MENSYLKGLFLKDTLDSHERNQKAQINSSEKMHTETLSQSQRNFLESIALQRRQQEEVHAQNQITNQLSLAGLYRSGGIEPAQGGGQSVGFGGFGGPGTPPQMPQMPQVESDGMPEQPAPSADQSSYTPGVDGGPGNISMNVDSTPTRGGVPMTIGGQQVFIPSPDQQGMDASRRLDFTKMQDQQRAFTTVKNTIAQMPWLSDTEKNNVAQNLLTGGKDLNQNISQAYTDAVAEFENATANGDIAGAVKANNKVRTYKGIMMDMGLINHPNRAGSGSLQTAINIQARKDLSLNNQALTALGKIQFPKSKILNDFQLAQTLQYAIEHQDKWQEWGLHLNPNLIQEYRKVSSLNRPDPSISGTISNLSGAAGTPTPGTSVPKSNYNSDGVYVPPK